MADVLIIDDDKMMSNVLSRLVKDLGHNVLCAVTLGEGISEVISGTFDFVFLDVKMPDGNGLDILPQIRQAPSSPEVIIITAAGDPDGAEIAIKNGAWDYVEKPYSIKEMTLPFVRALQYREEKKERKPLLALKRERIVGNSSQMKACFQLVAQAANSDANVLITGETGTGKELFAWAIHENSPRAKKSFVVVDCATIPEMLVEDILFGHQKGAFTGADKEQDGMIKQADGGTLFLDEVGELPTSVQKAFLRVLQEHSFRPVGGNREVESHFRLVSATNRDLDKMVENGQFRNDLLFRLRSFTLELPPLKGRAEDIKELTLYHVAKLSERYGTGPKGFSPDFFDALTAYDWPGNVRELVHTIERALSAARFEPTLFPKHLPTHIRIQVARSSVNKKTPANNPSKKAPDFTVPLPRLRDARRAMEKRYLQDLISLTSGNIKEACQRSGLSRSRLYTLLYTHKISIHH